ncbi:MAG: hypothetical protein ACK41Q_14320 [Candidatus Brocadia sp.]
MLGGVGIKVIDGNDEGVAVFVFKLLVGYPLSHFLSRHLNPCHLHSVDKLGYRRVGVAQVKQFGVGSARVGEGELAHLNGGDGSGGSGGWGCGSGGHRGRRGKGWRRRRGRRGHRRTGGKDQYGKSEKSKCVSHGFCSPLAARL